MMNEQIPLKLEPIRSDYQFHKTSLENAKTLESIQCKLTADELKWLENAAANTSEKSYRRGYMQGYITCNEQNQESRDIVIDQLPEWRDDLNPAIAIPPPSDASYPMDLAVLRFRSESRSGMAIGYMPARYLGGLTRDDIELSSAHHEGALEFCVIPPEYEDDTSTQTAKSA